MTCEQIKLLIDPYLDGELSAERDREFRSHLSGCPVCQGSLALAQRLTSALAVSRTTSALEGVPLPSALSTRIRAGVAHQAQPGLLTSLLPGVQPSFGRVVANLATVLVLAVAVASAALWVNSSSRIGPRVAAYQPSFTYLLKPNLDCVFTDTTATTDKLNYDWKFGDDYESHARNPEHTYAHEGVYTITLSVEGPAGEARLTRPVNVERGTPDIGRLTPTTPPSATPTPAVAILATATALRAALPTAITIATPSTLPSVASTPTSPSATRHSRLLYTPTISTPIRGVATRAPSSTPFPPPNTPEVSHHPASPTPSATLLPHPTATMQPQPTDTLLPPSSTPQLPTNTPAARPSITPGPPTVQPSPISSTPRPEPTNTPPPEPAETEQPTEQTEPPCTPGPGTSGRYGCDSGG